MSGGEGDREISGVMRWQVWCGRRGTWMTYAVVFCLATVFVFQECCLAHISCLRHLVV